jgi:hypothetical protein
MAEKIGLGTFITDQTELTSSGLDSFSVPPVDTILKEGKTVYYYPVTSITDAGPYEFQIVRDPDHYIHLPMTRLEGELEIKNTDGTAVAAADKATVCNLFTQSIFKQVECELNGTEVCDLSTPTYAYKSFIETHLTYGKSAKETHLYCSLYEKDTPGKEDTISDDTNLGGKARKDRTKNKKIQFSNIIHSDFFQCHKYLIPNTDIKLKFIRNSDSFSLIAESGKSYKIVVNKLRLLVRKIKIDPAYQQTLEATLATTPALYNLTQSKIKTFNIHTGTTSIDIPNIIQGNLPRSVHIGFVTNDAFNGIITANPFKFGNQGINHFNLKINGIPVCPTIFQPDFSTDKGAGAIREYRWFMDNCGIQHENETNGITYDDFINNSCFWNFDLTPDLCNSFHLHETKSGSIDVSIGFKTAPANPLYMIVYACYNSAIAIDVDRNVRVIH